MSQFLLRPLPIAELRAATRLRDPRNLLRLFRSWHDAQI
jgi:hypothetical protein